MHVLLPATQLGAAAHGLGVVLFLTPGPGPGGGSPAEKTPKCARRLSNAAHFLVATHIYYTRCSPTQPVQGPQTPKCSVGRGPASSRGQLAQFIQGELHQEFPRTGPKPKPHFLASERAPLGPEANMRRFSPEAKVRQFTQGELHQELRVFPEGAQHPMYGLGAGPLRPEANMRQFIEAAAYCARARAGFRSPSWEGARSRRSTADIPQVYLLWEELQRSMRWNPPASPSHETGLAAKVTPWTSTASAAALAAPVEPAAPPASAVWPLPSPQEQWQQLQMRRRQEILLQQQPRLQQEQIRRQWEQRKLKQQQEQLRREQAILKQQQEQQNQLEKQQQHQQTLHREQQIQLNEQLQQQRDLQKQQQRLRKEMQKQQEEQVRQLQQKHQAEAEAAQAQAAAAAARAGLPPRPTSRSSASCTTASTRRGSHAPAASATRALAHGDVQEILRPPMRTAPWQGREKVQHDLIVGPQLRSSSAPARKNPAKLVPLGSTRQFRKARRSSLPPAPIRDALS